MITLLTAVPGAGKTAYAVKMLLDDKTLEGRPIYTNITGLKLPHFQIDADWMREWFKNAPPNAYILFDECQDVFPPRHVSREPPEYVQLLSKHRKDYSVDFFLITQGPQLIDHAVKALVGRYLYIRQDGLITMLHESRKVMDFEDKTVRETHAGKPYSIPKEVFDLYTSAEVHTKKPRRKLPTSVYVFAFAMILAVGLGVYVYQSRFAPALAGLAVEGEQGAALAAPATPTARVLPRVPERLVEAITPTDPDNHLSAPLYAAVVPSIVAPEIVGCISSKRSCTCFSQQQTPVWVPEPQCRDRAAGLYFDPYRNPVVVSQTEPMQTTTQEPPPSRETGGVDAIHTEF